MQHQRIDFCCHLIVILLCCVYLTYVFPAFSFLITCIIDRLLRAQRNKNAHLSLGTSTTSISGRERELNHLARLLHHPTYKGLKSGVSEISPHKEKAKKTISPSGTRLSTRGYTCCVLCCLRNLALWLKKNIPDVSVASVHYKKLP